MMFPWSKAYPNGAPIKTSRAVMALYIDRHPRLILKEDTIHLSYRIEPPDVSWLLDPAIKKEKSG